VHHNVRFVSMKDNIVVLNVKYHKIIKEIIIFLIILMNIYVRLIVDKDIGKIWIIYYAQPHVQIIHFTIHPTKPVFISVQYIFRVRCV
jgi:hypothetical protein